MTNVEHLTAMVEKLTVDRKFRATVDLAVANRDMKTVGSNPDAVRELLLNGSFGIRGMLPEEILREILTTATMTMPNERISLEALVEGFIRENTVQVTT